MNSKDGKKRAYPASKSNIISRSHALRGALRGNAPVLPHHQRRARIPMLGGVGGGGFPSPYPNCCIVLLFNLACFNSLFVDIFHGVEILH